MLYGPGSSRKTSTLCEIIAAHPDDIFYVIDIENKFRKVQEGLFPEINNIVGIANPKNWDEVEQAFEEAKRLLVTENKDKTAWLMIEALDKLWDVAQADWDKAVLKMTPGERIEAQVKGEIKRTGIGKWEWVKTKHNQDFMDVACFQAPFHVVATAQAEPFTPTIETQTGTIREDPEVFDIFKPAGFKAGGEKHNHSRFDTIIALNVRLNPRKFMMATIKDTVRPYMSGGAKDFWMEYEGNVWETYKKMCQEAKDKGERVLLPM